MINKALNIEEYKKALHRVFAIHIFMFLVSFAAAMLARSSSVFADSIDFIGDAGGYALSLYVLRKTQIVRASVSIAKSFTMMGFGLLVLVYALQRYIEGTIPDYEIMIFAGLAGILSHLVCIAFLWKFRNGDSNQVSVWICTINDLFCNSITVIAAILVWYTNSIIPDIVAAILIVSIAIYGAWVILKRALKEIKDYRAEKYQSQNT